MSEKVKCGGYIYKWGSKVGCTDYTIPEEVFKKGAPEERVYPVTDGNFLIDDPFSVLGTAKVRFDDEGAWADITIVSEPCKEALKSDEKESLKLGFMFGTVQKNENEKTIVTGKLRAIDISEVGMHSIEHVSFYGEEDSDDAATENVSGTE